MRTTIICLLLISSVFTQDINEIRDLFSQWKVQYNKEYSAEAEEMRFGVFSMNYAYVRAWNAAGNSAVLALNQFADLTNEEFGAIYTGAQAAPEEVVQANLVTFEGVESVPSTWSWLTEGAVTPIKNQEQCGSCWAFATVATTEGLYKINGNTLTSFSEQQIVDCDTTCDGCGGGFPYLAMKYVANNGLETEADYPYVGQNTKCTYNKANAVQTGVTGAGFVTPKSAQDLFAAVYQQPVAIIVEANQNVFQLYSSGVISSGCGTALDHAITAIGYTEDYFIVKNSWGTSWGQNGYVWISSSTDINAGLGACGIFSQPQFPQGLKN